MFSWLFKRILKYVIFARFTIRARKVMSLAKKEARVSNRKNIGTTDILRGLLKEGSGVGFHTLKNLNVSITGIESEIEKYTNKDVDEFVKKSPQILPAMEVIVLAKEESRHLNHNYIGTEHLLLGLLRFNQGIAAKVLACFGVTIENAREGVIKTLGGTTTLHIK
jgi:ATP-dependent Clp protease ATP-binding subunit ClpC